MENNLNNIFTHEDTKKIYRREKVKYFKLFRAVMIFVAVIGVVYIGWAMIYLQNWNTGQLQIKVIQAPETHLAMINGRESVIYTRKDGTRLARVQYKKCSDVAIIGGIVEHCDREIISVKF